MHLSEITYFSQVAENVDYKEVESIGKRAQERNQERDITGALLFDNRFFLQRLEGDRTVISETYSRITRDSRHHSLVVVSAGPIEVRLFPEWAMKYVRLSRGLGTPLFRHQPSQEFCPQNLTSTQALGVLRACVL